MADESAKCGEIARLKRIKCNQNFLSSHHTLISRDKRLAICGCGNKLVVYSIKTGKLLRKLDGHETDVVDYYFRVKNSLQVISADKNGVIILWDIIDGTIVKKMTVPYSISALMLHPTNDEIIYIVKNEFKKKKDDRMKASYTLQKIDLTCPMQGESEGEVGSEDICRITTSSTSVAFCQNGNVIAYIKGSKLHIISLKDQNKREYGFQGKVFTSIAFHPHKMMIATGNEVGKIVLWSNFLGGRTPTALQLHWHLHPVDAVSFTHDGLYLLSGGLENVLVIWQLASQNKDFLPRMGAQIKFISISEDDMFVSVTLSNNVVKIVSLVDRRLTCTLQGLSEVTDRKIGLKVDPRSGSLVVPVFPHGRLQFYNPEKDSVLSTFDVVGENYIIGPKLDAIHMSKIDQFDFNGDGSWLATIEYGKYELIPNEVKLKFWHYDVSAQKYHMVTIAETPHDVRITCLRLRPRLESSEFDEMAITADKDGKIKFWVLQENENEDSSALTSWKCLSACSYGSSSCNKAVFSRDGSLFAVIYGKEIAIWDSETRKLRTSFYCPVKDRFREIVFGAGSSEHYLLTRSTHYIMCWNLLSCSMCWSIEAKITCMTVDPLSGYFAVFSIHFKEKNKLCLLDAATSKVVLRMAKSGHCFRVRSMTFSTFETVNCKVDEKIQKIGKLYALTTDKDIYKFDAEVETYREFESLEEQVNSEFANIFGSFQKLESDSKATLDTEEAFKTIPGNHSAAVVRKIIGTPSHVLPSVTSLSSTFFTAITLTHSPACFDNESDEELESLRDENNENSDSDEEPLVEMDRTEVAAQKTLKVMEADSRRKLDLTERTQKVNFNWIAGFISSNYNL